MEGDHWAAGGHGCWAGGADAGADADDGGAPLQVVAWGSSGCPVSDCTQPHRSAAWSDGSCKDVWWDWWLGTVGV